MTTVVLLIIGLIFLVVGEMSKTDWLQQTGDNKNYRTAMVIGLICVLTALFC